MNHESDTSMTPKGDALASCPFCGVGLMANKNQGDLHVRRYGTHYMHPDDSCCLSGFEVTPSEVAAWNRRLPAASTVQPEQPALGFAIDPPGMQPRVLRWHDGGCRPAWDTEVSMWDVITAGVRANQIERDKLYTQNVALRELLEHWSHESHLQSFEDRERFRKAARKLLDGDGVTGGSDADR